MAKFVHHQFQKNMKAFLKIILFSFVLLIGYFISPKISQAQNVQKDSLEANTIELNTSTFTLLRSATRAILIQGVFFEETGSGGYVVFKRGINGTKYVLKSNPRNKGTTPLNYTNDVLPFIVPRTDSLYIMSVGQRARIYYELRKSF